MVTARVLLLLVHESSLSLCYIFYCNFTLASIVSDLCHLCMSNRNSCIFFFQIYEKVASVFKLDEGVVIANLDADKHRDLAEKYVLSYIQK